MNVGDPIHLAKTRSGILAPGDYPKLACGVDPTDAQWDTSRDHVTCPGCKDADEKVDDDED